MVKLGQRKLGKEAHSQENGHLSTQEGNDPLDTEWRNTYIVYVKHSMRQAKGAHMRINRECPKTSGRSQVRLKVETRHLDLGLGTYTNTYYITISEDWIIHFIIGTQ